MDDERIREVFDRLGPVTIKRMFGGKGIYHDGLIVALEVNGDILLKADARSAPEFSSAGSRQWTYAGKNKPAAMPYWSIPERAVDDPEELALWTRKAFEAARRSKK